MNAFIFVPRYDEGMPKITSADPDRAQSPALGRRERAKADKRARILGAARELLRENGFERMTVVQVADRADVAVGTVFQYAASKAELLMMVVADEYADTIPAVLRARTGRQAPAARIRQLLEPLATRALQDPDTSAAIARELLFGTEGPHRGEVIELVASLEREIARTLHEDAGAERAEAAARLIVAGAILELNRTRTARASRGTVERRLVELVDLAIAGATGG